MEKQHCIGCELNSLIEVLKKKKSRWSYLYCHRNHRGGEASTVRTRGGLRPTLQAQRNDVQNGMGGPQRRHHQLWQLRLRHADGVPVHNNGGLDGCAVLGESATRTRFYKPWHHSVWAKITAVALPRVSEGQACTQVLQHVFRPVWACVLSPPLPPPPRLSLNQCRQYTLWLKSKFYLIRVKNPDVWIRCSIERIWNTHNHRGRWTQTIMPSI